MALTEEQKQRILASPNFQNLIKKSSVTPAKTATGERLSFVERARLARGEEVEPEKEGILSKIVGGVKETAGDIKETVTGIGEAYSSTKEDVQAIADREAAGEQGGLRSFGQAFGRVAGGISSGIGEAVVGAGKAVLPQKAEEAIKSGFTNIVEAGATVDEKLGSPIGTFADKYKNLDPKAKADVDSLFGIGSLALDLTGAGLGRKGAVKGAKVAAETGIKAKKLAGLAKEGAEEVLSTAKTATGETLGKAKRIVTKDVLGTAKDVSKKEITEVAKKQAKNLNKVFDESTVKVRKQANFLGEQDINIGEEITRRKIEPIVENDRLKFKDEDIANIRTAIKSDSEVLDKAIAIYKEADITADYLKDKVTKLVKSNKEVVAQGRVDELTKKAYNKIDEFLQQNDGKDFTISQINDFKKGMYSLSKKFKPTSVADSDAFSELGRIFKQIVEDEVPDVAIKNLNKEIGKNLALVDFLENVKTGGGIVMKGGKLGKHFEEVAGRTVGAGIGLVAGGPVGAVAGGFLGGEVATLIRTFSQKASILSYAERNIIKKLKAAPTNPDLLAAKKFLEDVKEGLTPTLSERAKNLLNNIIKDKKPTELPKNIKK